MRLRISIVVALILTFAGTPLFAAGARPKMVTAQAELAMKRGLAFLAKAQHKRGSWSGGTGYGATYEAAMTGITGVALLASGSTPTRGPYSQNIRRAIYWVLSQQNRATGLICSRAEESRSMYGHGFCTLFLAEALGMCGDKKLENRIRTALQKAIKLIEGSQSDKGGWIYTPTPNSDEGSVTVTQVQALRACQNAGVQVNKKVVEKAFGYLTLTKCKDGGIAYSARSRGSGRPALTAAAWTCLNSAGKYNTPLHRAVKKYCLSKWKSMTGTGNRSFGHTFYTNLYLAEAMYQDGGAVWHKYYPLMRDKLIKTQKENGAWQGDSVGLVYGTSIAITILSLPYGYFPVVQR
jgi:squalene cyclase